MSQTCAEHIPTKTLERTLEYKGYEKEVGEFLNYPKLTDMLIKNPFPKKKIKGGKKG